MPSSIQTGNKLHEFTVTPNEKMAGNLNAIQISKRGMARHIKLISKQISN
jgi:hypothetical protein